ncbi:MAG: ABC transporter permease subunit [Candidatus Bipolaricaulota bacterium]
MNGQRMWSNVRLLFAKELIGAIRDRRTMILTIFFPLFFYPLILAVIGHFTTVEQARVEEMIPRIVVVDHAQDVGFISYLQLNATLTPLFYDNMEAGLADVKLGIAEAMMLLEKEASKPEGSLDVTLYYDQTTQAGTVASARVSAFLEDYLREVIRGKLDALGVDYDELSPPLTVRVEDIATSESIGKMIIGRLLPYFMVLAILTGAMGLGAEITAGEKERGTIATLLVSQLSRTEIVLGKFLTVLTVSLVSSLLSAVGLLVGMRFFGGGLAPTGATATFSLGAGAFGWMIVVLVPLAVILAALVVIVGSFARSQKEASTYLMPIYMIIVLVGLVSMTGGVSFLGARFLIPVANTLYALQEIIVGTIEIRHLIYTFAANAFCGALLIAASIRLFKREAILFRS